MASIDRIEMSLIQKFTLSGTILGKGACGKVELVIEKATKTQYAYKWIFQGNSVKPTKTSGVRGEHLAGFLPAHPNLLRTHLFHTMNSKTKRLKFLKFSELKNSSSDDHIVGFVSEYCHESFELFEVASELVLNGKEIRTIGQQIGAGLEAMHKKDLMHRDIKPANILITSDLKVKIIDFGFTRILEKNGASTPCGTTGFIAPEVFRGEKQPYGIKADAWSFGVLLYKIAFGSYLPFDDEDAETMSSNTQDFVNGKETIEAIAMKIEEIHNCESKIQNDPDFWSLLNKLICHKDKRITVGKALDEPFLRQNISEDLPILSQPQGSSQLK